MEQTDHNALWTSFIRDSVPAPSLEQILRLYGASTLMRPLIEKELRFVLGLDGKRTLRLLPVPELLEIIRVIQDEEICEAAFRKLTDLHEPSNAQLVDICIFAVSEEVARTACKQFVSRHNARQRFDQKFQTLDSYTDQDLHDARRIEATLQCNILRQFTSIAIRSSFECVATLATEVLGEAFGRRRSIQDLGTQASQDLITTIEAGIITIYIHTKHQDIRERLERLLKIRAPLFTAYLEFMYACIRGDEDAAIRAYPERSKEPTGHLAYTIIMTGNEIIARNFTLALLRDERHTIEDLELIVERSKFPSVVKVAAIEMAQSGQITKRQLEWLREKVGDLPEIPDPQEAKNPEIVLKRTFLSLSLMYTEPRRNANPPGGLSLVMPDLFNVS